MRYEFIEFDGVRYRPDDLEIELRRDHWSYLNDSGELEHIPALTHCTIYARLPGSWLHLLHLYSGPVNFGHKLVGGTATLVVLPALPPE